MKASDFNHSPRGFRDPTLKAQPPWKSQNVYRNIVECFLSKWSISQRNHGPERLRDLPKAILN